MFKKIYREFFYVPKFAKMTDKVFKGRIGLSVLTMVVSCVLFCATTFAWFNAQQTSQISPIVAADYSLSISINGEALEENEYTCPLAQEDRHVVTLTATGTATTGYCEIRANGNPYITVPIPKEQTITLTIVAAQGTVISFSAHWGTYSDEQSRCGDGASIEISDTPYQSYTVADGVTLDQIAAHYGVAASDILLYNGISEITVGTVLKIPNTVVTEPLQISTNDPEETSVDETTEPTQEPTEPTEETTETTQEPTEETTEPTQESTEPTEPT